jgi:hypothetical protein
MERVTEKQLKALVERINVITGNPTEAWTKQGDGTIKANIGNYHLDWAYSGCQLCQMMNEGGGVNTPIGGGFWTKREMSEKLRAYIYGLEYKANELNKA